MEKPNIKFEGKKYYLSGCKKCQVNLWYVGSDGKDFVAQCSNCGHKVLLKNDILQNKPDHKAIDMRFVT